MRKKAGEGVVTRMRIVAPGAVQCPTKVCSVLTRLQPQGKVAYNMEEEQKEEWSVLGLGGFVAEVLAAIALCHICSRCLATRPLLQKSTVSVDQHLAVALPNLLQAVLVCSTS